MKTFKVTNFKGIRGTVEVSVDGGSVIVSGKNRAGKSSFIDAITELFDARGIRFTPHPINAEADNAESEFIDTELNVRIVRRWKRDENGEVSMTYSAYTLDGARHKKSPAALVAELLGGVIFDPSRFLELDPKPQRDALLRQVQLPFDLDEIETEEAKAEQHRLAAGQIARAAEGAVTNAERPEPGTPAKSVSTTELVTELEKAKEHNRAIDSAFQDVANLQNLNIHAGAEIEQLEAKIQTLKDSIEARNAQISKLMDEAKKEKIDTSELEQKVQNVDKINKNVQLGEILRKLEAEAAEKRSEWKQSEDAVKAIQKRKADGLKEAVFPHPSLSVSDAGVLFDGVPFTQVNDGQREEAAMAIAMAGDPDLRLIVMKKGEEFDEDSLARIDRMAVERGFTVLIERGRPDVGGLVAEFVEMVGGQRA